MAETRLAQAWALVPSPVGELILATDGSALTHLLFTPHKGADTVARWSSTVGAQTPGQPVLVRTAEQLAEYFAGEREEFDVPLAAQGSVFQQRVWAALVQIPYGATESYGALALRLGLPVGAARAVGLANGSNPISIIVPCHRVIGANGSLTGYGGGIERKQLLLDLERADVLF